MSNPLASTAAPTTDTAFVPRPLPRLDRALAVLRSAGVPLPARKEGLAALTGLSKDLLRFGEAEVTTIVRVLSETQLFNELVRTQLNGTSAGERYVKIAEDFDSIRRDSKRMLQQMEDGKLSIADRLGNSWIRIRRGDINDRFNRIRETATDIHRASEDTVARMRSILEAYGEVRLGLQESRILSSTVRDRAREAFQAAQGELTVAAAALQGIIDAQGEARAVQEATLARDIRLQEVQEAERRFQMAEDLFNNLSIAYNAGDAIMVRIRQTADVQQRVWTQSVTFFGTNESVLTALSVSTIHLRSLHETTQGHKALKDGINEAIKDLASTGTKVLEAGLREGYGPTVDAAAVRELIESIVTYQEQSYAIKDEMRQLAQANEAEIHKVTEEGRKRLTHLLANPPPSAAAIR